MNIDQSLAGQHIYGDDFDLEQIVTWFKEEEDAYAMLGAKDRDSYSYKYDVMNELHGFKFLNRSKTFERVLGYGSAYGDELKPLLHRLNSIIILEPSDKLKLDDIGGKPALWVKPDMSGRINFPDGFFDLITCFGVLHHVPNVTYVISELGRVLKEGGTLMMREPIVSMGDWRLPRKGLTKNERGIPLPPLLKAFDKAGLRIKSIRLCGFGPLLGLLKKFNINVYQNKFWTWADWVLAEMFSWNYIYHAPANSFFRRFRPTCLYVLLERK